LDRVVSPHAYGSSLEPSSYGSGGGVGAVVAAVAGSRGGGILHIVVQDALRVDGRIHVNGGNGVASGAGGGSGGSLLIRCGELQGDGSLEVNGGAGKDEAGGGAGGRLALWFTNEINSTEYTAHFTGEYQAFGGTGRVQRVFDEDNQRMVEHPLRGGAGTVVVVNSTLTEDHYRWLLLDNNLPKPPALRLHHKQRLYLGAGFLTSSSTKLLSKQGDVVESSLPGDSARALSNLFDESLVSYFGVQTSSVITVTVKLFRPLHVSHVVVTPRCDAATTSQYRVTFSNGGTVLGYSPSRTSFARTDLCIQGVVYPIVVDAVVSDFMIELQRVSGATYAALADFAVFWQEEPTLATQSDLVSHHGAAWLLPSEEPAALLSPAGVLWFNETHTHRGGSLNLAGARAALESRVLEGDNTGVVTVRPTQVVDFSKAPVETRNRTAPHEKAFPFSFLVHDEGLLRPPPRVTCTQSNWTIFGDMERLSSFLVEKDCYVSLQRFKGDSKFVIDHLQVKQGGHVHLEAHHEHVAELEGRELHLLAGARLDTNDAVLKFERIEVEPFAVISADGTSYLSATGVGHDVHGGEGEGAQQAPNCVYGQVCGIGSSGAGHGGTGGVGLGQKVEVGPAYGNFSWPKSFGSRGGARYYPFVGGAGGGRLHVIANESLRLDGEMSARGGDWVSVESGGGSGGSILIEAATFDGHGSVDVSGGLGYGKRYRLTMAVGQEENRGWGERGGGKGGKGQGTG
jgi:hypothetical protein